MSKTDSSGPTISAWLTKSRFIQLLGGIAAAIAVPAFIISLPPVQNRLFDSSPLIEIELASEVSIFDVKQPLSNLKVTYNNQDLTSANQSLVASIVRIRNSGGGSLTPADASPSDPLGFSVTGGSVIRINRVRASSNHLKRLARPVLINDSVDLNSGLIFDDGDYVEIELLIIKDNNAVLKYTPSGKVARQNTINFVDIRKSNSDIGFVQSVMFGTVGVQMARLFMYTGLSAGLVFLGGFVYSKYEAYRLNKRRKVILSVAHEAYEHLSGHEPVAQAFAIGLFSAIGYSATKAQLSILRKEYEVSKDLDAFSDSADMDDEEVRAKPSEIRAFLTRPYMASPFWVMQLSKEFGLTNYTSVSAELIFAIEDLIQFLETKPQIKTISPLSSYESSTFDEERYFAAIEKSKDRREKLAQRKEKPRTI